MRIRVGDREYPLKYVEELTLLDLLTLEAQTRNIDPSRPLTMYVLRGMERSVAKAIAGLSGPARVAAGEAHPDAPWLFAVMIWAARRAAGEDVTFAQAIEVDPADIEYVREAGDEPEPDPLARRSAASAAGDKPPRTRSQRKTSGSVSSVA